MQYDGSSVLAIHPDVRLRNDDWCVTASNRYRPTIDDEKIWAFRPSVGLMVSMFDGERTVDDVADIVQHYRTFRESPNPFESARAVVLDVLDQVVTVSPDGSPRGEKAEPTPLVPRQALPANAPFPTFDPTEFVGNDALYDECYEVGKFKQPLLVQFIGTERCATRCLYCYMSRDNGVDHRLMPWERVRELVEEIHGYRLAVLDLLGGEVILYRHFWPLIDLMADLRFPAINLSTKTFVSRDTAERLHGHPAVASLQFSIDSAVPAIADYLTQTRGFVERVRASIENCLAVGFHDIDAKAVITPYNVLTIPDLVRTLDAWGVRTITVATYGRAGRHHHPSLHNWRRDFQWLDRQLEKLKKELPHRAAQLSYQNGAPEEMPPSRESVLEEWYAREEQCTAGRTQVAVYGDGSVTHCEQTRIDDGHILGSVRGDSLENVWNSETFTERTLFRNRDLFKGTPCFDCDEYDRCKFEGRGCVRDAQTHFGTMWGPIPGCPRAPWSRRT